MKIALKKIDKETIAKFVASMIIPGGFIIWGIYEYTEYQKKRKCSVSTPKEDILRDIRSAVNNEENEDL